MTATVASPTESRAARRFKTLSDASRLMRDISSERLLADLPDDIPQRVAAPRFRARLERRFLLRTGAQAALPDLIDGPAGSLVSLGDRGLHILIVDTGIMCQFATLRQIVDQSVLTDLSTHLGISLIAHDARRAVEGEALDRARDIASPHPVGQGEDALVNAILRDGLQCWNCWIHSQKPSLGDFFRALTPSLPQDGSIVATEGCRPRDCERRAALFAVRFERALTDREESN